MSQKVGRREIEANEATRRVLNGTAGLVQCDGCHAGVLVPDGPDGPLCERHRNDQYAIRYEA